MESSGSSAYPDLNPEEVSTLLSLTFEKFVKTFKELTSIDILGRKMKDDGILEDENFFTNHFFNNPLLPTPYRTEPIFELIG